MRRMKRLLARRLMRGLRVGSGASPGVATVVQLFFHKHPGSTDPVPIASYDTYTFSQLLSLFTCFTMQVSCFALS
ncbi:hypothetical protein BV25DRAFT_1833425 [Artomyces pyxidatus]|uniref:Uncharacterized protein n=1 Tax=Artomyces pyxidatus TaxID=48021 RepID=A0ACB8SGQ3_9AGAM|nr:hypothetical protein BV25DRAFT_1833425 [Artomyces pyxidatus]